MPLRHQAHIQHRQLKHLLHRFAVAVREHRHHLAHQLPSFSSCRLGRTRAAPKELVQPRGFLSPLRSHSQAPKGNSSAVRKPRLSQQCAAFLQRGQRAKPLHPQSPPHAVLQRGTQSSQLHRSCTCSQRRVQHGDQHRSQLRSQLQQHPAQREPHTPITAQQHSPQRTLYRSPAVAQHALTSRQG